MKRRAFLTGGALAFGGAAGFVALAREARAEPPKRRIRIGQIGTAHAHAAGKLSTIRTLSDEYELVGVVEPDAGRRAAMQKHPKYKDVPWLTEEQLLDSPGIQAVAVETAVRDLVPTATRCVEKGLHVHLDKPGGESLAAFGNLLERARKRNVVVQMGYMLRYNPAFQFLFRAVREGWLGTVFEVHGVMSRELEPANRRELAEYPGGAMFELGCHLIDSLVTVLGTPQKITPFARTLHPERDALVDNQIAVFEYPQATATIRAAVVGPFGNERRQFVVCGEAGTIAIQPLEPARLRLTLKQPRESFQAGSQDVTLPDRGGRYDSDFLDLARIIRGEKQSDWSFAHDLAVHEAVLRASGVPLDPEQLRPSTSKQ